MIPEQSPLDIYLEEGITAVMMYGEQGKKKQSEAIWADSFCRFIENFDKQDMAHYINEDQNYFIMQLGDIYFILTEFYIMIFFLVVTGFILSGARV